MADGQESTMVWNMTVSFYTRRMGEKKVCFFIIISDTIKNYLFQDFGSIKRKTNNF